MIVQPKKQRNNGKTGTRSCNPNYQSSFNRHRNCIKSTANRELQKALNERNFLLNIRLQKQQQKKRNMLVQVILETKTILRSVKPDCFL